MRSIFRLLPTMFLLFIPMDVCGGDGPKEVRAARVSEAPIIDGSLTDAVWNVSSPASDFVQLDPSEGDPATEPTEIRVLYDDEALYFGCMFYDSEPENIVARLTRRDNEIESDRGSIRIDSYHDHQTAYEFTFNAAGVKVDILQYDDASREDDSWDPVWQLETQIVRGGWIAELKIPFSILRYETIEPQTEEQQWGINFIRHITRSQEETRWVFTPKNESGFVSRFGHLTGLRGLPTPGQVELLPFVVGQHEREPARSDQDERSDYSGNGGLDLKYNLASNFVLDATINPDFGQVEVDPAVLNLTTFEVFFPERRPFFIEGTQIIRFSTFGDAFGPGMFYSRRIGRAITIDEVGIPSGGKVLSFPKSVSILGAAKFSGKTSKGLSLGVLQAFTEEETAIVEDSLGVRFEPQLEPFAHYNVVRLRQDLLQNSNVGLILTTVAKDARSPAITAGGDWSLRFGANTFQLDGFVGFSRTTNRAQERVNGSAGKLQFSRIAAKHWLWNIGIDFTSRNYNINDVGFFFRPDDYGSVGSLTYKQDRPTSFYRDFSITLFLHERRNFDGLSVFREVHLGGSMLFANYWSGDIQFTHDGGEFDDRETRGNGNYRRPHPSTARVSLQTDSRADIIFGIDQLVGMDTRLMEQVKTRGHVNLRPVSWMQWNLEGGYDRIQTQEAWVDNVSLSDGSTASIFADRSTETYDIVVRGAVTFTRTLTLEVFGQILLARGNFREFRRLVGTSDFIPFDYSEDADFNDQWLNLNVVFRWEYLPGSTMFFVWSRAGQGTDGSYRSSFGDNFDSALSAPSANVLLLKISYWLNI